ncbi:MAG: gliding motility-associated C-terminal domain-containing protein, partial [Bacteroidetes bacterium]|nr:gliding motility-associated C-terminal domain-containing protein [Bacteroidota bacterium]
TFPDGTLINNIISDTVYVSSLIASTGCDSIVTTNLTINSTILSQETVSVCSGGSYTFPDGSTQNNITVQVVYNSNLTTTLGCDSIIETTVSINPTYNIQETVSICSGGSYTFPDGTTQTNIIAQVIYTSNLTTNLGCDSIIETTVNVNPIPTVTVTSGGVVCIGSAINFTPTSGGTWTSSNPAVAVIDNSGLVTGVSIGTANMIFTDAATGCPSNPADGLVIVGGVTASITATPTSGFMPLDVVFNNGSTTGVTYTWDFGDGTATSNQFELNHTYTNLGNYLATLIVSDGLCYDTASVTIEVIGQSTILIPNVFTPNGDGSNDVFTVDGENLESVEAEIFNRWGQKMYEWKHVKGYWDGRTQSGLEAPDGTYFYIISAKGFDGEEYFKKGGFSLIR